MAIIYSKRVVLLEEAKVQLLNDLSVMIDDVRYEPSGIAGAKQIVQEEGGRRRAVIEFAGGMIHEIDLIDDGGADDHR